MILGCSGFGREMIDPRPRGHRRLQAGKGEIELSKRGVIRRPTYARSVRGSMNPVTVEVSGRAGHIGRFAPIERFAGRTALCRAPVAGTYCRRSADPRVAPPAAGVQCPRCFSGRGHDWHTADWWVADASGHCRPERRVPSRRSSLDTRTPSAQIGFDLMEDLIVFERPIQLG